MGLGGADGERDEERDLNARRQQPWSNDDAAAGHQLKGGDHHHSGPRKPEVPLVGLEDASAFVH